MSIEFAYQFRRDEPRSVLLDLDRVALTVDVRGDEGESLTAGAEGTIVSVYRDGEAFVVEFTTPDWALATVGPESIRLVEHTSA